MNVCVLTLLIGPILAAYGMLASGSTRTFDFKGKGRLELVMPVDWQDSTRDTVAGTRTITFSPSAGSDFTMIITIAPDYAGRPQPAGKEPNGSAELQLSVERTAKQIASRTIDVAPAVRELDGVDFKGYYFTATDRAPAPDGFPYLTQGAMAWSNVRLSFTILTHKREEPSRDAALLALQKARWIPAGPML